MFNNVTWSYTKYLVMPRRNLQRRDDFIFLCWQDLSNRKRRRVAVFSASVHHCEEMWCVGFKSGKLHTVLHIHEVFATLPSSMWRKHFCFLLFNKQSKKYIKNKTAVSRFSYSDNSVWIFLTPSCRMCKVGHCTDALYATEQSLCRSAFALFCF